MFKGVITRLIFGMGLVGGAAIAGPRATVIFKNVGTEVAQNVVQTANESSSYNNASPKPAAQVAIGGATRFDIINNHPAPATSVVVTYKMGSKICNFGSVYTNYDGISPVWSKTANPKNGAHCTANIISTYPGSHEWTVEFTMR